MFGDVDGSFPKSRFLDIDEKELDNVNKGSWKTNVGMLKCGPKCISWVVGILGFDTKKSITNLVDDEKPITKLVMDMLAMFIFQPSNDILHFAH
jgi:hypothetical protein